MRWADAAAWKVRELQLQRHLSNEVVDQLCVEAIRRAGRDNRPMVMPRDVTAAFHQWQQGQVVSRP